MNSLKTDRMLDEIAGFLFEVGYADCDIWMEDHNESYREEVGKIIEKAFEESRKEIEKLQADLVQMFNQRNAARGKLIEVEREIKAFFSEGGEG